MRRLVLRGIGLALASRARTAPAPARGCPRVLLIRPDHIGDVVLTSPAVELLRRALPGAHLTMMVGPWSEDVARRDELLDEVLTCPYPGFTRTAKTSAIAPYQLLRDVAMVLHSRDFDAAVVLRHDHWWGAWLAAQARIPLRVGYRVPECRPFLNRLLDLPEHTHWTERSLALARSTSRLLGGADEAVEMRPALRFRVWDEDEGEAASVWSDFAPDSDGQAAILHPGSGAPLKLWPERRWIELGNQLAARGLRLLITGSTQEAAMAARIAAGVAGAVNLAGRVGLGGLAALLRRCVLAVGTDNGPMHIAAAVDTPSVRLFGPTDPAVYGPWGDPTRHLALTASLDRVPCGRLDLPPADGESPACMRAITVDQVESACQRLLSSGGRVA